MTIVRVTPEDVKGVIDEILRTYAVDYSQGRLEKIANNMSMYEIRIGSPLNGTSIDGIPVTNHNCYISVKIPADPEKPGQAIHLNVRYDFGDGSKSVQIYPERRHEGALGGYWSKSIKRTKGWADKVRTEVKNGVNSCLFDDFTRNRIVKTFKLRKGIGQLQDIKNPIVEIQKQNTGSLYPDSPTMWSLKKASCYTKDEWQRMKGTCLKMTGSIFDEDGLWYDVHFDVPTKLLIDMGFINPYRNNECTNKGHIWVESHRVCIENLVGKKVRLDDFICKPKLTANKNLYYSCSPSSMDVKITRKQYM